jgi:hypothetical protein
VLLLLLCFVIWPLVVLVHELGHAAVALAAGEGLVVVRIGAGGGWQPRLGRLAFEVNPVPVVLGSSGGHLRHWARLTSSERVACILAGPLLLLGRKRFDDVLDGATFGATCAVSWAGAELLTRSTDFLSSGLRPIGLVTPWVLRVLCFGVAIPVVFAAAIGAAAGGLWLRFRAPRTDRPKHPLLEPAVSIPLAVAAVVGAALVQLYLTEWAQLAALAGIALVALVWLRQVIHLGLLEEAKEIEIGAPVRCANCGHMTPNHTFCVNCGIALRALPKQLRPSRPAAAGA